MILLRAEVDGLALHRGTAAVDTGDERLGRLVRTGAATVDERVRAQLLDHVDLDGDALALTDELEVLGTDADGHAGLVGVREGRAVHGQHGAAELDTLVGELLLEQVHRGGSR